MDRQCMGCDAAITPGVRERNIRKWCSEACRIAAYRRKNPDYVARQSELAAARHALVPKMPKLTKTCPSCGTQFETPRDVHKFCSRRCAAVFNAQLRRARGAGAKIGNQTRWRVFERDEWTCKLCGNPVDRSTVFPDRRFPTIDHIVPVSRGGAHDESNFQTACHSCNSGKCNRAG